MKLGRVVGLFVVAGFVVAVSLAGVSFYLNTHGLADTGGARFSARFARYLWPTGILMMDADGLNSQTLLLVISATLNGLIYGFVGWCGYSVWQLFAGPKDEGWWPSKPDK